MCLYSLDYTINHNEDGDENEKKNDKAWINLGLDMDINTVNLRSASV